jgi:L-histidine Nalpha-methyltransferase
MNVIKQENTPTIKGVDILDFSPDQSAEKVKSEIISGLIATRKHISSSFFYDKIGSELFEEITRLEAYYPSKAEKEILSTLVDRLGIDLKGLNIIELGSGDASKISLLFEQIPRNVLETITYFPVDISKSAIEKSTQDISNRFYLNSITGVVADFNHQIPSIPGKGKKLYCFFGSTIGNLSPDAQKEFLSQLSKSMQSGDALLLGVDLIKDISTLEAAYNDKDGVTEAFNKNILCVVNSIINSNLRKGDFDHLCFYNTRENRIEMHLKARKDICCQATGKQEIAIRKGETIHTENSYKFNHEKLEQLASCAGLTIGKVFTDSKRLFSLALYRKP